MYTCILEEYIYTVLRGKAECSNVTQDGIASSQIFTKLLQLTHTDATLSQWSLSRLLSELQVDFTSAQRH